MTKISEENYQKNIEANFGQAECPVNNNLIER